MLGTHSADETDSQNAAYPCNGTCVGTSTNHWVLACMLICTYDCKVSVDLHRCQLTLGDTQNEEQRQTTTFYALHVP